MISHWRKFLLGVVICVALVLVVLWGQRRASLQDDLLGQIAYESYNDQESAIYLMNPDGSHRSQVMLVKASSLVCCATWSNDGKQLAYAVQHYDPTSPTSVVESFNILIW